MTGQEVTVLLVGVTALGYVLARFAWRRRKGASCGGGCSCPATEAPPADASSRIPN